MAGGSATTSSTSRSRQWPAPSSARRCRSATVSMARTARGCPSSRTRRIPARASPTRRASSDPFGEPVLVAGSPPEPEGALVRTTRNQRGQGGETAVTRAVEKRKNVIALGLAVGALFLAPLARGLGPQAAQAASHREAPLISLDPTADITDFFMFRDYAPGQQDKVALIMDVIPGEEPSSGPNYWNFDPNVLYKFSVDNNGDGSPDDVELEFRFRTEPVRGIASQFTLPFSYA